ncbi:MAG: hypothetical protein Q9204_001082 [Flavoplaca sp. TL-2023a]
MNSTARLVKKTCTEQDKVDERLERIRENVWPSDPYLMDLVSPSSYHLPPHLANNWRRNCPFDKNEEHLQYMTFLAHTGRGDTMLRTTGDWDDGNGSLKTQSAKRTSGDSSSGAISPLPGQPPRKKISLLDYNRKKAEQTGGKTSPKATHNLPAEKPPYVAEVMKPIAKVGEPVKESSPQNPEQDNKTTLGYKRSSGEITISQGSLVTDTPEPASKKVQTAATHSQASPARTISMHNLPRMLSPTLPACIEERLAKLHGGTGKAESQPARNPGSTKLGTDHDKAINIKIPDKDEKNSKPIPKHDTATANGAATTTTTTITADRISAGSGQDPNHHSKVHLSKTLGSEDVSNAERRLRVILRIPKNLRKNWQRIVQLQPRPKKLASGSQPASLSALQGQSRDRTVSKGLEDPYKEPPKKRQRLSDVEPGHSQTPVDPAGRSPDLPQHSSGHMSRLSTPKADRKSTAMDRIKSSEGEVKTPLGSMRSNTPMASSSIRNDLSNITATSASTAKKDDEISIYGAEFTKYADLAKTLKREADALTKVPGGNVNPDSTIRRRGLAKGIETAICYMLAFTIKDEPSRIKKVPRDRAPWISLLPYFQFLQNLIRDIESLQLQGFLYQLEAVCYDTIHQYDLERLEREIGPTDEKLIKQVAESGRQARQSWINGTKWLTHDELGRCFPETWAQRSRSLGDKPGRILPKDYRGGYYLPLSNISTNIEAVRAGWYLLKEWTKQRNVEWDGRIGL